MVDPEMFRTFFLPGLTKLSKRYNGIGIHCCAKARHQWENFSRIPGLRLMNMQGPDVNDEVYDLSAHGFVQDDVGASAELLAWGGPAMETRLRGYVETLGWVLVVAAIVAYVAVRG
mgnify:CR=1 FL=1